MEKLKITDASGILTSVSLVDTLASNYIELNFNNYPSDWHGFKIALYSQLELDEVTGSFLPTYDTGDTYFNPTNAVTYSRDGDPLLVDGYDYENAEDGFLYGVEAGTNPPEAKAPDIDTQIRVDLDIKRSMRRLEKEENMTMYFMPFTKIGNDKIYGKSIKEDILINDITYIDIDEPVEKLSYKFLWGSLAKETETIDWNTADGFESRRVADKPQTFDFSMESGFNHLWFILPTGYKSTQEEMYSDIPLIPYVFYEATGGMPVSFIMVDNLEEHDEELGLYIEYRTYRTFNAQASSEISIEVT